MAAVSWFDRLFHRPLKQGKRWPVLQIEVTTRCMLHCGFCPNRELGGAWLRGDLPWDVYRECLGPHLGRFETVYLQGWGEPMLHPRLWDMIALAKAAGAKTGFTTCGGLLSAESATRILDLDVDILAISFAGASAGGHERLRMGSRFDQLTSNVAALTAGRRARGKSLPFLELHFLMQRDNIVELPAFARLAAGLGADEVVATNVTYTPTPEVAAMAVFAAEPQAEHLARVEEAREEARRAGVKFRMYPLTPSDRLLECDARPTESCYVTFRGKVAPCVYLGLPVDGAIPRMFDGEAAPAQPVAYGDARDGFLDVFQGPAHAAFCAPFRARKGLARLAFGLVDGSDAPLPAPPEPCAACYKLKGL